MSNRKIYAFYWACGLIAVLVFNLKRTLHHCEEINIVEQFVRNGTMLGILILLLGMLEWILKSPIVWYRSQMLDAIFWALIIPIALFFPIIFVFGRCLDSQACIRPVYDFFWYSLIFGRIVFVWSIFRKNSPIPYGRLVPGVLTLVVADMILGFLSYYIADCVS